MSKETEGTAKRGASNTWIDRQFHLAEHGTTVRTEILAGITTFVTMAYVLGTVPNIMANAGLDRGVMLTSMILLILLPQWPWPGDKPPLCTGARAGQCCNRVGNDCEQRDFT